LNVGVQTLTNGLKFLMVCFGLLFPILLFTYNLPITVLFMLISRELTREPMVPFGTLL